MATYKVPQDVEADDKLIGPFSFRQFIYLIVVAISGAIGWALWSVLPPLALLMMPPIVFFGALALPLRKDQPMEIYLAAIISYYLKPHIRLWKPDGIESLVEVTAPRTIERRRTKDLSQTEAEERLNYLATLVDTQGWAVRGVDTPPPNTALNTDVFFAAQTTEDVLDDTGTISRNLDQLIIQSDQRHHQEMIERMKQPVLATPIDPQNYTYTPSDPYQTLGSNNQNVSTPLWDQSRQQSRDVVFNPYPNIVQSVVQPLEAVNQVTLPPVKDTQTPTNIQSRPSETHPSPDIINLANNTDLSIETIAREANRLHKKHEEDQEVVIKLH